MKNAVRLKVMAEKDKIVMFFIKEPDRLDRTSFRIK